MHSNHVAFQTLILDCSYSGTETRAEPRGDIIRGADIEFVPGPARNRDAEIVQAGTAFFSGIVQRAPANYVLLAASGHDQVAAETKEGGDFTIALLNVLRTQGCANLTYKSCIQNLQLPNHPK